MTTDPKNESGPGRDYSGMPHNPTFSYPTNDWEPWVVCNDHFHADAPNRKGARR